MDLYTHPDFSAGSFHAWRVITDVRALKPEIVPQRSRPNNQIGILATLIGIQYKCRFMSVTGEAADILEGEADRLLWFPVVTLGYIFTLSGNGIDFALAVGAVAGVRFLQGLMESLEMEQANGIPDLIASIFNWGGKVLAGRALIIYPIVVAIYGTSIGWSVVRLHAYFTHTDIVIVGLSVVICGSAGIVLVNLLK